MSPALEAVVHRSRGEFFVTLTLRGKDVDEAGPFDDEHDATCAARRMASNVRPLNGVGFFTDVPACDARPQVGEFTAGRAMSRRGAA